MSAIVTVFGVDVRGQLSGHVVAIARRSTPISSDTAQMPDRNPAGFPDFQASYVIARIHPNSRRICRPDDQTTHNRARSRASQ